MLALPGVRALRDESLVGSGELERETVNHWLDEQQDCSQYGESAA